jgi:hypothetical protein
VIRIAFCGELERRCSSSKLFASSGEASAISDDVKKCLYAGLGEPQPCSIIIRLA